MKQVKFNKFVITGYNLGAHVAGICGKTMARIYNMILRVLIAITPSGLFFSEKDSAVGLDRFSATFVFVVHTAKKVINGIARRLGRADVYFPRKKPTTKFWNLYHYVSGRYSIRNNLRSISINPFLLLCF